MAQADRTALSDNTSSTDLDNGVTAGTSKPLGGDLHVYGFNSRNSSDNLVAYFAGQAGFVPTTKGGSIRAAIRRGPASGNTGFAPFMYVGLQGTSKSSAAYILGLSDADPFHISLRKGTLATGVPDGGVNPDEANNILLRSTASFTSDDAWMHLRLDMIVQGTGDVLLQVFQNDLSVNSVQSPNWIDIPGMEGDQSPLIKGFVDDALQVNTGSAPFTAGRIGFGFRSFSVGARSYFDHIQVARQL